MANAHSIISQTLLEDFAAKRTVMHNSLTEVVIKLDKLQQHWVEFEDLYFQIFTHKNTQK